MKKSTQKRKIKKRKLHRVPASTVEALKVSNEISEFGNTLADSVQSAGMSEATTKGIRQLFGILSLKPLAQLGKSKN